MKLNLAKMQDTAIIEYKIVDSSYIDSVVKLQFNIAQESSINTTFETVK